MSAENTLGARGERAVQQPGNRAYQYTLTFALGMLGFFLPFSVAGTSIALALLLVLALLVPQRLWQLAPWREPVVAVGLVLFAWIAIRVAMEPATVGLRGAALNRYHELLMIPLLWGLLRLAKRPDALWRGILVGTFAYAAAHWMVGWFPEIAPRLESRRISGGLVFPICAFLLFEQARTHVERRWWLLGGALFLLATSIFFSDGRTGHLLSLVVMGCIAWRAAPRRYRLTAALAVMIAATCVALLSSSVRVRLIETFEAAQAESSGAVAATSTGYRIQVWRHGAEVAGENALLGAGWANYRQAFESKALRPENVQHWMHSDNPHNEFLMQLGGGGVVALALFIAWLAMPLRAAWRARAAAGPWPPLLACVTIAFAVGCVFNSLLLDFAGGHFHAAILAWLLARQSD